MAESQTTDDLTSSLSATETKEQLVSQLDRARANITRNFHDLTDFSAIKQQIRSSIRRRAGFWVTGAALLGGLVGWRILGNHKKEKVVYVDIETGNKIGKKRKNLLKAEKRGVVLGILGFLISIVQPAATAFFSRRLAAMVNED